MPPGRPPKPTLLHQEQGTYRNDRHGSRSEPEYAVGLPEPPSHLDIVAKRRYAEVGALLVDKGVLTEADQGILALYADAWSNWVAAVRRVRAEERQQARIEKAWDETLDAFVQGDPMYYLEQRIRRVERMKVGESPAVKRAREERLLLDRFAGQLGLSPSMRAKVSVAPKAEAKNEMEGFLDGTG
jgi:P27 family predicted phage terminase small subunit